MKNLTKEQVYNIIEWMDRWEQLKGTDIPMLFESDYIKQTQQVNDSLLTPSLDKRFEFAEELIQKIDGDMPVSAILAATYWMEAEIINLNR